jgi:glycine/D-amino acid oxidase-like deaminating enzyme
MGGHVDTMPDLVPIVDHDVPGPDRRHRYERAWLGIGPAIGRILADMVIGETQRVMIWRASIFPVHG